MKEAKNHLAKTRNQSNSSSYICLAVAMTNCDHRITEKVQYWIYKQLKNFSTVVSWAETRNVYFSSYEEQQKYRHAWVDHMIKVLES